MGKSWENHGEILEHHGKLMGKAWNIMEKKINNFFREHMKKMLQNALIVDHDASFMQWPLGSVYPT